MKYLQKQAGIVVILVGIMKLILQSIKANDLQVLKWTSGQRQHVTS